MVRASWAAVAWLLVVLVSPSAVGYRDCYLHREVCMDYDWTTGHYAEVQTATLIVGAGRYNDAEYTGYTVHAWRPNGTYVSVYDGVWHGNDFTLVAVGVNDREYVWYYQDTRVSEEPGDYHCFTVTTVYWRCGTGLP